MTTVTLRVEPDLCGPMSVGTVALVKLVSRHLALGLGEAVAYVNRCVFDGEEVDILAPSAEAAACFIAAVQALPPVPRVLARVRQA